MNQNPRAIETLLSPYIRSGYPALALETYEPDRVLAACLAGIQSDAAGLRPVYSIAAAGGLRNHRERDASRQVDREVQGYASAFAKIAQTPNAILIVHDWQHICTGAAAYRPLLQALPLAKSNGVMFVFVAPTWTLPAELKHELPVISVPLPTAQDLRSALDVVTESIDAHLDDDHAAQLCRAAQGLTSAEAENAFALSALRQNGDAPFNPSTVEREKMRLVKSQCMSVEAPAPLDSLGGLDALKEYITAEVLPSASDPQLSVRGLLLVGVPGTGKSLTAKVIASMLKQPLIRLDVAGAKGSLVGQSEGNVRHALSTADAVSPCVLWIDEIEKGVGGYASSSQTDGGTTAGMVGTLLTWMQEHTSPVITVATCNDWSKLPPELTRAGRFDERFFLDLPTLTEREAIARVHLARLGCPLDYAGAIARDLTDQWTGAEIEQLVKSAARRTNRNVAIEAIHSAAADIIPISRSANIRELREWAAQHLRRANSPEAQPSDPGPRRRVAQEVSA